MIRFIPTEVPPEAGSKADEHLKDTIAMWRVRYGPLSETQDHIDLAILGLVPMSFIGRDAYFWMSPLVQDAPRAALREAKIAFLHFEACLPWRTFVCTEVSRPRNTRFASFMGYTPYDQQSGIIFGKRV